MRSGLMRLSVLVRPGERLKYTLRVTNHGLDDALDVQVTDSSSLGLKDSLRLRYAGELLPSGVSMRGFSGGWAAGARGCLGARPARRVVVARPLPHRTRR